ncbi:MAG: Ig-like domain repeat protein [Acidobacteriaceae bacterium]|jgi:streptogramin lyase
MRAGLRKLEWATLQAAAALMAIAGFTAPRLAAQSAPLVLPYTITTIGGGTATVCGTTGTDKMGNGCPATQASFGATSPIMSGGDTRALAVDAQGNIIIADTGASMIRKINPKTGLVTVVAGSLSSAAACTLGAGTPVDKYGDGCVASDGVANLTGGYTGSFNKPRGVSVAPNGDIYIAGYGDYMIHKISAATGVMSVVAGYVTCTASKYTSCAGTEGYTGDGGTATNYEVVNGTPQLSPTGGAELYQPRGVTTDSYGNIYIADTSDNAIRVVYEGGTALASLIATEVPGTTAQVGYIYTIAGNPTKIAGGGSGYSGDGGLASAALLTTTEDVIADSSGDVIVADGGNDRIRVIYGGGATMSKLITLENPSVTSPVVGYIYTVMGGGTGTAYTAGTSVPANSLLLGDLRKIAMDSRGDLFAIDNGYNVVWFEDASTGYIRSIAGMFNVTYTANPSAPVSGICTGSTDNIGDGCPATQAVFSAGGNGMGMAIDGQDNLYLTDPADTRIRKISIDTLFAATTSTAPLTNTILVHLGAGETTTPAISFPYGTPDFSENGTAACTSSTDATVNCLIGITFQPAHPGADASALLITGTSTGASIGLNGTGTGATVSIDPGSASVVPGALSTSAQQIAVDGGGNAYVADAGNNQVLYFPANGSARSVIAGGNGPGYGGDNGSALSAKLNGPKGVAVDAAGNVYIADTGNNAVRRVDRVSQYITTLAGGATGVCPLASDAYGDACPAAQTTLSAPSGVAAAANGSLYISDTGHNLVRVIASNGYSYLYAGGTVCAAASDTYGDGCSASQAAFSSPAGLAVDGSSNLFIADSGDNVVRKIAYLTGIVTAVAGDGQAGHGGDGGIATSAQLTAPQGVAVDAAGDVFIADTGNNGLRTVNQASGVVSTLAGVLGSSGTGTVPGPANGALLNAPRGVAVTAQGTIYVADSSNGRLLQVQRSKVSYNFGTVNVGAASDTQPFTLTSSGTTGTLFSSPSFTGSGVTADLTLVPATSQGCSSGTLAVGTFCSMIGQFSPTSAASETATYALSSSAANAVSPAILLSGTGKFLIVTSVVAVQTTPAGGSPQYGQTVTVAATVTPASTTVAMTGTITFKVDGVAGVPVPIVYAGGVATASYTISSQSVGAHTVTAIYSGDFNYAASNDNAGPLTLTVVKAATMTGVAPSPLTLLQFSAETITATVASTTTGTPTGTVSFYNGAALLGTSSLNSSGVATFTSSTLAVGSYKVIGVYGGDGNYATSTSTAGSFAVSADPEDFELTVSTSSLSIASGSTVQTTLFVTPTNTLADTLTFACSGLPQYATCTFGPPSTLAVAATTNLQTYWQQPIAVTITFWSDIAPVSSSFTPAQRPGGDAMRVMLAIGWPAMLIGLGALAGARKGLRRRGPLSMLGSICLLAGAAMTLSGCSAAVNGMKYTTPVGTSSVNVTVTGKNSATHSIPVQYTITGPGF